MVVRYKCGKCNERRFVVSQVPELRGLGIHPFTRHTYLRAKTMIAYTAAVPTYM
jgi:hypothetical protein